MDIVSLAAITILCGVAAVFFFMQSARLRDDKADLQRKAAEAEADARKQADRAEAMRRKLELARNDGSEHERELDKSRKRLNELKDECKRQTTAAEKATGELKALDRRARAAERRAAELQAVVEGKGLKAPVERSEPEPVVAAAPVAAPTGDPEAARRALRRAELDAERAAQKLEIERLRTERELSRAGRLAEEERAELKQLRDEREVMTERIMRTELGMRIARRKLEDNRRAYIVTAKKLEQAEDELYRLGGKDIEVPERKPLATPEELAIELGAEEARKSRKPAKKAAAAPADSTPAAPKPAGKAPRRPKKRAASPRPTTPPRKSLRGPPPRRRQTRARSPMTAPPLRRLPPRPMQTVLVTPVRRPPRGL